MTSMASSFKSKMAADRAVRITARGFTHAWVSPGLIRTQCARSCSKTRPGPRSTSSSTGLLATLATATRASSATLSRLPTPNSSNATGANANPYVSSPRQLQPPHLLHPPQPPPRRQPPHLPLSNQPHRYQIVIICATIWMPTLTV